MDAYLEIGGEESRASTIPGGPLEESSGTVDAHSVGGSAPSSSAQSATWLIVPSMGMNPATFSTSVMAIVIYLYFLIYLSVLRPSCFVFGFVFQISRAFFRELNKRLRPSTIHSSAFNLYDSKKWKISRTSIRRTKHTHSKRSLKITENHIQTETKSPKKSNQISKITLINESLK